MNPFRHSLFRHLAVFTFLLTQNLFFCLKTSVQVPSPVAGVIEELLVPDGGKVESGTALFTLRKGGLTYYIFRMLIKMLL